MQQSTFTSNEINYQFVKSFRPTKCANFKRRIQEILFSQIKEDGCAEILLAIPEVNYYGDEQFKKFITQKFKHNCSKPHFKMPLLVNRFNYTTIKFWKLLSFLR